MNRRNFLFRGLSIVACAAMAIILPRPAKAKSGWSLTRVFTVRGLRAAIVVAGQTPSHLIEGIPGTTYLKAGVHLLNDHRHAYFDGEDVDFRCSELDLEGRWARMFEMEDDGKTPAIYCRNLLTGEIYPVKSGDDLWQKRSRNPLTGKNEETIEFFVMERIHFGKVEVR